VLYGGPIEERSDCLRCGLHVGVFVDQLDPKVAVGKVSAEAGRRVLYRRRFHELHVVVPGTGAGRALRLR
jgi:hypothetical protein